VIRGRLKKKIDLLLKHNISVFGFHLPLDAHPQYGNNAQLIKTLGLVDYGNFAFEGKHPIGYLGKWSSPKSMDEVVELLNEKVGEPNFVLNYGKTEISTVGICSGSYPQGADELIARGDIDLYITGEIREQTTYVIQEEEFNFIAAGHHQTERFGPRAVGELITKEFNIPVEFVDVPNPV
jgi:putative NIF3 family GTP cyclohydrolase 1 type 2